MARIRQIKKIPSDDEIEIGDQVKHPKFGMGTVLYKSGTGDRAKAIVVFPEEGQKKLLLKYAKLKKIKEPKPAEEGIEPLSEAEIITALEDSVASPPPTKKERKRKAHAAEAGEIKEKEEGEEEEEEIGVIEESEEVEESEEEEDEEEAEDREESPYGNE